MNEGEYLNVDYSKTNLLKSLKEKGSSHGQLPEGVNEFEEKAIKKQEYSACNQCLSFIYLGDECLEWKSFEGTALNICFCNEKCITEAKSEYEFLDRKKIHVKKPDHVVVDTPIIFKCLLFGLIGSQGIF